MIPYRFLFFILFSISFIFADSKPPYIKIIFPLDKSDLKTSTKVKTFVTDKRKIEKVSFIIDGNIVYEDSNAPFEYDWDICAFSKGGHSVYAIAKDIYGNEGISDLLNLFTNANYDCDNVCGGIKTIDNCGICDDDFKNDCVQDCAGQWGGEHWVSNCGCVPKNDSGISCIDCAGKPFGKAFIDDCNQCVEGSTNLVENNLKDCMGTCYGKEEILQYWYDSDGDGLGAGNPINFCSGDIELGWVLNNSDLDDSCHSNIYDCMKNCNGEEQILEYWYDSDGDGLGAGNPIDFCSGEVELGWVLNNNDIDDNCFSNQHDCYGLCDGDLNSNKDCDGICFGPNIKKEYCYDVNMDGDGNLDTKKFLCPNELTKNWVENCSVLTGRFHLKSKLKRMKNLKINDNEYSFNRKSFLKNDFFIDLEIGSYNISATTKYFFKDFNYNQTVTISEDKTTKIKLSSSDFNSMKKYKNKIFFSSTLAFSIWLTWALIPYDI